jgi:hypothetical protein
MSRRKSKSTKSVTASGNDNLTKINNTLQTNGLFQYSANSTMMAVWESFSAVPQHLEWLYESGRWKTYISSPPLHPARINPPPEGPPDIIYPVHDNDAHRAKCEVCVGLTLLPRLRVPLAHCFCQDPLRCGRDHFVLPDLGDSHRDGTTNSGSRGCWVGISGSEFKP